MSNNKGHSLHINSPKAFNSTVTDLHEIWFLYCLGEDNPILKILWKSNYWFLRYRPLKFRLFGIKGVPAKIKTPFLLNYWVNFDKIAVIFKEIVYRSHFFNKILLLTMFMGNGFLTLPLTLGTRDKLIFKYGNKN